MPRRLGRGWLWLVGALLLAGASARFAWHLYVTPGPLARPAAIVVPHGSLAVIAATLTQAGVIRHGLTFRMAALATRGDGALHAGELEFPAFASLAQILTVLRHDRPVQHRLTIPEGLTAAEIADLLDREPALSGEPVVPGEGRMLPETYAFERGATRASVARRAAAAMDRALAATWAQRSPGLPYADPHELLVMASLVERETASGAERAHVAGVFVHRLRQGMRLQSDPTVAYAVSGGFGLARPLTRIDLAWPTPYNTYTSTGLPPDPIDSPGIAALRAASRPLATDDLYFVADGQGGHAFAATLAEHERHVAHWRGLAAR